MVLAALVGLTALVGTSATPVAGRSRDDRLVRIVRLPEGSIQPQIATDDAGVVHVLYFSGDPQHGDLYYSTIDTQDRFVRPMRVNTHPGSAIATGTMRGGHLALGRNGQIHVAWLGSDRAKEEAGNGRTPVLYTRLVKGASRFEPERNVLQFTPIVDGDAIAADARGHVYVAWHGAAPGASGEADGNLWIARSTDDGASFAREAPAATAGTGACGCCGVGALADRHGAVYVLYRSATEVVHRGAHLLFSRDGASPFTSATLEEWNVAACPMSSFALAEGRDVVVAAWETAGRVAWARIDPTTGRAGDLVPASGPATNQKHPALAVNARGNVMLVWTEDTGWNKGGAVAWQLFDAAGRPMATHGRQPGVPVWGLAAVAARPDGTFTIVY
jgi:hypothetical protein